MASSASFTAGALRSAAWYTTTPLRPSDCTVRRMRTAISPRLATSTDWNGQPPTRPRTASSSLGSGIALMFSLSVLGLDARQVALHAIDDLGQALRLPPQRVRRRCRGDAFADDRRDLPGDGVDVQLATPADVVPGVMLDAAVDQVAQQRRRDVGAEFPRRYALADHV